MVHGMTNKQGHCLDVRDGIAEKIDIYKCARGHENCCTFYQLS